MDFRDVALVYVVGELVGTVLFSLLRRKIGPQDSELHAAWKALLKGMFERIVLIVGLLQGIPQIVIAFGALKIGTRLHDSSKISNDYFLIGNLLSILIALIDVTVIGALSV